MAETEECIIVRLEALGEDAVRVELAKGNMGDVPTHPYRRVVEDWLRSQSSIREAASADRAEAREEENLSISRKALANSERATRIAISAIVLSISMAILEIIKWYSK